MHRYSIKATIVHREEGNEYWIIINLPNPLSNSDLARSPLSEMRSQNMTLITCRNFFIQISALPAQSNKCSIQVCSVVHSFPIMNALYSLVRRLWRNSLEPSENSFSECVTPFINLMKLLGLFPIRRSSTGKNVYLITDAVTIFFIYCP